jgi:hypothetical protein
LPFFSGLPLFLAAQRERDLRSPKRRVSSGSESSRQRPFRDIGGVSQSRIHGTTTRRSRRFSWPSTSSHFHSSGSERRPSFGGIGPKRSTLLHSPAAGRLQPTSTPKFRISSLTYDAIQYKWSFAGDKIQYKPLLLLDRRRRDPVELSNRASSSSQHLSPGTLLAWNTSRPENLSAGKPLSWKPLSWKPLSWKPLTWKPLSWKPLTWKPLTWKPLTWKPSILSPSSSLFSVPAHPTI